MTDNKWFKGNGFLTEEGERAFIDFNTALENIIAHDDIRYMSQGEIHTLQANLAKKVGDATSAVLAKRLQEAAALESMTDTQFVAFMDEKYGKHIWPQLSLSPAERIRANTIRNKK